MIVTTKKIISILIAAMLILAGAVYIYAEDTSGKCGDSARWVYDEGAKTLTVTGSGAVDDIKNTSSQPWKAFSSKAEKIVVSQGITRLGNNSFKGFDTVTSVSLPSSVSSLGNYAFSGCTALVDIKFPSSLKNIGSYAFEHCFCIESVSIPQGTAEISDGAFSTCSKLKSVTIPSSVSVIGKNAFKSCKSLTEIEIPSGVSVIGANAFDTCSKLETVKFASRGNLTEIGERAFSDCSSLKEITIPTSVNTIGDYAFFNCSGVKSLVFETTSRISYIGDYAFSKVRIEEAKVPASTVTLGDGAFYACSYLKSISVPSSLENVGEDITKNCNMLETVKIGRIELSGDNVNAVSDYSVNKSVTVTLGTNQKYAAGGKGLSVTVNNSRKNLSSAEYAGVTIESSGKYKAVPEEYVTVSTKGLTVKVSDEFLSELPNGIHTIYVATTEGVASTDFSLTEAKESLADYFADEEDGKENTENPSGDSKQDDTEENENPNTGAPVFLFRYIFALIFG